MIERVMLLDAVLDEPTCTWLGPAIDKRRHFMRHLESRLETREYPHLTFGDGPARTVRYFTELAEMGVADHVLESISGHLLRRMLEHYSHIRIDAKRQALDALDNLRRGGDGANGNGTPANGAEIATIVEVADDLTSQFGFAWIPAYRKTVDST